MTNTLQGIKVLDFSMGVAAPKAGALCAQYGAQVIKIEPPGAGDWGRSFGGLPHGDLTPFSTAYNRGKSSLAIDLKDPEARSIVLKMAEEADVILENFRPGAMKRLGLDYASLQARNPGLVYLSVTGFGQTGPLSDKPATDVVIQAFSGFMTLNADRSGMPQRLDMVMFDMVTGLYGFQAILASLFDRQRTGTGKHIDCSLMMSALALQTPKLMQHAMDGDPKTMYVPIGSFTTADGCVAIGVRTDEHFDALCRVIGRADLAVTYNSKVKRRNEEETLMAVLREEIKKLETDELVEKLSEADVHHAKVQDYDQVLAHPQVQAASAVTWVKQDGIDCPVPVGNVPGLPGADTSREAQAPHLGEHSMSVLESFGVPRQTIEGLIGRGAVGVYR